MNDEACVNETVDLIRQVRRRLESLSRAGVDRLPIPIPSAVRASRTAPRTRDREETPAPKPVQVAVAPEPVRRVEPPAPSPRPAAAPAVFSEKLFGEREFGSAPVDPNDKADALGRLAVEVAACERCPVLVANRTRTVFGVGNPNARLMFVGEAPGADEDATGEPFVGRAGRLLTDMITKGMGLRREDVYIANVLKSRPPENRQPLPDEIGRCLPFLEKQIEIIRPEFLCLLGKTAIGALLETVLPMGRLRGRWHRYRNIPTVVTWHPSYLLRTPSAKKEAWEDLQLLMQGMGLRVPESKSGKSVKG